MLVKRKYVLLGGFAFIIIVLVILFSIISPNNGKVIESGKSNILNTNALTMMYETGYQSGEYQVASETMWPQDGYVFNETLSRCENGSILTWEDEYRRVVLSTSVSDK